MGGEGLRPMLGAARIQLHDPRREPRLEFDIHVGPTFLLPCPPPAPGFLVAPALLIRLRQRRLLDEQALALVAAPCPAEADNDGRQPARLLRPACERSEERR